MPEYHEYDPINAGDLDGDDIILWLQDGVTKRITRDEQAKNLAVWEEVTVADTTYTILATDQAKEVVATNAAAKVFTVPSTTGFLERCPIVVTNLGAGDLTFAASGTSFTGSAPTIEEGQSAVLKPRAGNTWHIYRGAGGTGGVTLPTLAAPDALDIATPTTDGGTLTFTDTNTSPNEDGYEFKVYDGTFFDNLVDTFNAAADATSVNITGLAAGTNYRIFGVAKGDGTTAQDSTESAGYDFATAPGITQLAAPVVSVGSITSTGFQLTWSAVTNANQYVVEVATDAGFASVVGTQTAGATNYTFSSGSPSTTYYWRVKAQDTTAAYTDSAYDTDSQATSAGGGGVDADAAAVIAAVETSGKTLSPTEETAIDTFFTTIKANGTSGTNKFSKLRRLHIYVAENAAGNAINWINPGTNDVVWSGTINHNAPGVLSDGTTGKGSTGFVPSADSIVGGAGCGAYSITNIQEDKYAMGGQYSGAGLGISPRQMGGAMFGQANSGDVAGAVPSAAGYSAANRISGNCRAYKNGSPISSSTALTEFRQSEEVMLLCVKVSGTDTLFSNNAYAAHVISDGFNDAEHLDFYNALETLLTVFGLNA